MTRAAPRRLACGALAGLALGACSLIETYPELAPDPASGGGGSTSSNSGGRGGGGGGDHGGGGGDHGGGGGGASTSSGGGGTSCVPTSTAPCYTGPPITEGVGLCAAGVATCLPDGSGYGACAGETLPAPEVCTATDDEDCDGNPTCDGSTRWSRVHGGPLTQRGMAIATAAAGDVWVTGSLQGTVDLGGGPLPSPGVTNVFVLKLGPSGDHLFSAAFGNAVGRGVAVDAAGHAIFAVACFGDIDFGGGDLPSPGGPFNDVCLVKLGASGQHVWSARYGDNLDQTPLGVAVDAAGRIAVAGTFRGTLNLPGVGSLSSAGGHDAFVAVLDPDGAPLWSARFGTSSDQSAVGVAFDGADVVLVGTAAGAIDFGGGALPGFGGDDVVVARLSPSGEHMWSHRYGSSSNDAGLAVAAAPGGELVVAGAFRGSADFGDASLTAAGGEDIFVRRMAPDGSGLFTARFGDGQDQAALGVAVDAAGYVALTGRMRGTVSFGGSPLQAAGSASDVFVAKLDAAGDHVWSRRFGDALDQLGAAIAVDGDRHVLVTGELSGAVDFGDGPHPSADGTDLFVLKLEP